MVNRHGVEVTTAVTNLDIHDIARSCTTYGVTEYFVVNPEPEQEKLVGDILGHWKEELSSIYHPARAKALSKVSFLRTYEEVYNEVMVRSEGLKPFVVMPDARRIEGSATYKGLRERIEGGLLPLDLAQNGPYLQPLVILLGTGWGIAPRFFSNVDCILDPILGPGTYNHLSVRAAAAVVLDKLFGSSL